MKKILLFFAAAVLAGCVWMENPVTLGKARKDIYPQPERPEPVTEVPDTGRHLYIAAVEYPEGYDWVRDTARGTVDARMLLFKDGECVLSLPAGDRARIGTDPDTHHLIGGNLYTTWSDGKRTCIKCNGEDLFDYEGGESMFRLAQRIYNLLDDLKKDGRNFILVAHNGIARVVESYFREMTNDEYAAFGLQNGEIREYRF